MPLAISQRPTRSLRPPDALESAGPEFYTNFYFLTGVNYSVMGVIDAYNNNALAEAYEYDPYGRHRVIGFLFFPKIGLASSCGDNTYGVAERYREYPGFEYCRGMGYVENYGSWKERWSSRKFRVEPTQFDDQVMGN